MSRAFPATERSSWACAVANILVVVGGGKQAADCPSRNSSSAASTLSRFPASRISITTIEGCFVAGNSTASPAATATRTTLSRVLQRCLRLHPNEKISFENENRHTHSFFAVFFVETGRSVRVVASVCARRGKVRRAGVSLWGVLAQSTGGELAAIAKAKRLRGAGKSLRYIAADLLRGVMGSILRGCGGCWRDSGARLSGPRLGRRWSPAEPIGTSHSSDALHHYCHYCRDRLPGRFPWQFGELLGRR